MRKVLIITYYWPPAGGAGVQRWLKFVKYLREFGWEPVIYTASNGEAPVIDTSLAQDIPENVEVIKTPIWEPYGVYKKFIGQKKDEKINTGFLTEQQKPKATEKMSVWVRGNFFIPDARKFWVKPSIKYLLNYLNTHPVDAMVSTGPPHSMHLIAMGIKRKTGLPWLADFRDPWTNIDFYKDLMLTSMADKKHRRLEREVLQQADVVTAIGNTLRDELKALGARHAATLTNGYDESDVALKEVQMDERFSLAHIGSLVKSRNHPVLWKALAALVKEHSTLAEHLEIKLVGKVDISVLQSLEEYELMPYLNKIDYLPHDEVIKVQQQSQALLLLLNNTHNAKGILTGKFFEYLSARRPIIGIGATDGDAARVMAETQAGTVSDFDDLEGLKQNILTLFNDYQQNKLTSRSVGIEKYSRKTLTQQLAALLASVVE